jgi:membrane associated rhomboid family serine protease
MWLDALLFIALCFVIAFQSTFTFVPLGNEKSTVRRLPWVTFAIMALNVLVYFVTLPPTVQQERELVQTRAKIEEFLNENRQILADEQVRNQLKDAGLISRDDADSIEKDMNSSLDADNDYKAWSRTGEATQLREQFEKRIDAYRAATEGSLWYHYGIAPNGAWKPHQLITSMFLHAGVIHLFGNLIFFFAIGFSLEDLWGRSTFLALYILGGIVAAVPTLIHPVPVPSLGASGAISATMGAFLIRLHTTKVKIGWVTLPFALPMLLFGKKPYGVVNVAAYVFLPFYFISQVLPWWFFSKAGVVAGVAYSAHVAGFLFGAGFALLIKATKTEERIIHPKIEAKISFAAPLVVTQALESLDRGDLMMAEKKLRPFLAKNRDNVDAILALIQVYERSQNFKQLNSMYGRLIRHYLENNDKEAALFAYDNLLSAFPDGHVAVSIPFKEWFTICEYLRESGMLREAAVEFERLVGAHPRDHMVFKAVIQGGESALAANDPERAYRLFEFGKVTGPGSAYAAKIDEGFEKCQRRLSNRPAWAARANEATTPSQPLGPGTSPLTPVAKPGTS